MKFRDNRELVEGLRELADFIEAHPELPITDPEQTLTYWIWDEKKGKEKLRKAVLAFGKARKDYSGPYFDLQKTFGPLTLEFSISRDVVCRRVVTGTKITPAEVRHVPERVEELVEWICDDPILAHTEVSNEAA